MLIVLIINLFTTRFVLDALGVVDFGVYNVVCGCVALLGFLNSAMTNGIQRFFNFEYGKSGEDAANRVYCTAIYIQSALSIIVVIIVELIGVWYLHNKMVIPPDRLFAADWIFQLSVVMFVLSIMQAPFSAALTAHEHFDFYAIVSVIDALLKLGIAYMIMTVSGDRLILYGVLMALVSLFNIVVYFVYCKKNYREIKFHPIFDKEMFKSMMVFSGWNLFGSFSHVMVDHGINLVLNFFFGPVLNAARGVAQQINGAVQSFVTSISVPVRPQVTQSYSRGEITRTMSLTYSVSKVTCGIVLILSIPASLEINYLLHLWIGDNIPEHTATFSIIILLTSLVTNLNAAISGVVHATGVMRNYQISGSLIRMCAVPIAFLLLKIYDIPEIALLSVFLCQSLAHSVGLIVVKNLVGMSIRDYLIRVVMPLLIVMALSIAILFGIHCLMYEGLMRLIIVSISSIIIVGSLFYWLGLNNSEKELVKKIFNSVVDKINTNRK